MIANPPKSRRSLSYILVLGSRSRKPELGLEYGFRSRRPELGHRTRIRIQRSYSNNNEDSVGVASYANVYMHKSCYSTTTLLICYSGITAIILGLSAVSDSYPEPGTRNPETGDRSDIRHRNRMWNQSIPLGHHIRKQNPCYHFGTVNLFRERIRVLISEPEPEPEPEPLSYFGAGNGSVF